MHYPAVMCGLAHPKKINPRFVVPDMNMRF